MNKFLIFIFSFFHYFGFSQESLEPLKTNFQIIKDHSLKKNNSNNNQNYIFLNDTINVPVIDDFSTDKFMDYVVDSSNNIIDTTWYALYDLNGELIVDNSTYMMSPSFKYIYDSVEINGIDTLVVINIENAADTLIVFDLSTYPIQMDTLEVWPNITYIDSTWTISNPDLSFEENNPDLFQDSLILFFVEPSELDFYKIWIDNDVYLNDNFAINPWTIGVVTFDGINSNGYPYDWSSPTAVGWADDLTSKPIFLGTKNISDSLYFSFYYQSGGRGEFPESDDSLVLEFYIPSIDSWNHIWSTNGFESSDWFYQHINLNQDLYFEDGFQFRFRSYGSLTGSLDHWNVDYIYLDENRSFDDTLMNDWAFTVPPNSVLENYTAMPWNHYKKTSSNLNLNEIIIPTYNSSNSAKLLQPCSMDIIFKNNIIESFPYAASVLNVPALSYFDMLFNTTENYRFDTSIADTFATFGVKFNLSTNTTPEKLNENDTVYHEQYFSNYYSYDDGSAESAYGLVGNGVEIAYRFELPEAINMDTLKSISIHFSPSVNDVNSEAFFIQIWEDDQGSPGSLIYTSDDLDLPELFYPQYNIGVNGFYEYELPLLVPVSGTYYIGWKQTSSERLNIGFDENTNRQSDIFYNMGSGFQNTIFEGALMMRPIFVSEMDGVLNIPVIANEKIDLKIYPNPATSNISIENRNLNSLKVYDFRGLFVLKQNLLDNNSVNVNNWSNGMYLFEIKLNDGKLIRKKVIIQH